MISHVAIANGNLATISGAGLACGLALCVLGLLPRPPSLKEALAALDSAMGTASAAVHHPGQAVGDSGNPATSRLERLGARAYYEWRLPIRALTQQRLARQHKSIGDFMVAKLALAGAGLVAPALVLGVGWMLGLLTSPAPLGLSLLGAVVGYFWPDLTLRRDAATWAASSADAVSVYFDLVTLIRLGNASAVQALTEAANLSDAPLFIQLRDALARARLQQRPPWAELRRLADNLGLPDVADLADIMALDEQGAALVDALRARVRELRKAHLAASRLTAQKQAEAMTVWMVVPVLVFALIFLVPPLMTMVAGM